LKVLCPIEVLSFFGGGVGSFLRDNVNMWQLTKEGVKLDGSCAKDIWELWTTYSLIAKNRFFWKSGLSCSGLRWCKRSIISLGRFY